MSHVVTRAGGAANDDRNQTGSPVKDMKKKMAANAEKEKQASEKSTSSEKLADNKPAEKSAEKQNEKQAQKQNDKQAEKHNDKQSEKQNDKQGEKQNAKQPEKQNDIKQSESKGEKNVEKHPKKQTDKQTEKDAEKKVEKTAADGGDSKGEKNVKDFKPDKSRQSNKAHQSSTQAQAQNGVKEPMNGTSSASPDLEDEELKDLEKDEHFPELVYEDGSDNEIFESSEGGQNRSITRRSQKLAYKELIVEITPMVFPTVKSTRTPETPKPATNKQTDKETNVNGDDKVQDSTKDTKLLKLKDDVPASDRRLRSADRHTPDIKEAEDKSQENGDDVVGEDGVVHVIEVDEAESDKAEGSRRKTDTNYAKSRVKVSPYRRGARVHDHTATSTAANYTGNNTTMEMDITESFTDRASTAEDPSLMDDSYIGGLRNIKSRKSYKQLKEFSLKELAASRAKREAARANISAPNESRPTGHVVGRKRRTVDDDQQLQVEEQASAAEVPGVKRMRLVDRVFSPFIRKTTVASSTPLPARRAAPIVGINTDLPMSAPTTSAEPFDPETLKQQLDQATSPDPVTSNKRCTIQ